ncbi:MAG: hypothetical protein COA64_16595 [Henriciella sp.]|jgi:hypothetical protein|nr:MAG: hypothetical protein COA64_16595 [Henriciella sp.]
MVGRPGKGEEIVDRSGEGITVLLPVVLALRGGKRLKESNSRWPERSEVRPIKRTATSEADRQLTARKRFKILAIV